MDKLSKPLANALTPFSSRAKLIKDDTGMVFRRNESGYLSPDSYIKDRIVLAPNMSSIVGECIINIEPHSRCEMVMQGMRVNHLILSTRDSPRISLYQAVCVEDGHILEQHMQYGDCIYLFAGYDTVRYRDYYRKIPTYETLYG